MEDRYAIPPSALGRLHSVGFWEATQRNKTASFHHVNLLPEDDSDLYIRDIFPTLVSVGIDKSSYEWMEGGGRLWGTVGQTLRFPGRHPAHLLPYCGFLGGMFAPCPIRYLRINGFPNSHRGWDHEDEDMAAREGGAA